MENVSTELTLIRDDGVKLYPYIKTRKSPMAKGYALAEPGKQDRFGEGFYTTNLDEAMTLFLTKGYSLRVKGVEVKDGKEKKVEGSYKLNGRSVKGYEVSKDLISFLNKIHSSLSKLPLNFEALNVNDRTTIGLLNTQLAQENPEEKLSINPFVSNETSSDIQDIVNRKDIPETTKKVLVDARVGQGKFKNSVIEAWGGDRVCILTGIKVPELLIASHIKSWKDSDDIERLDGANGLLLSANIDKLFDRHLITFKKNHEGHYQIVLSNILNGSDLSSLNISTVMILEKNIQGEENQENFDSYMLSHNELFEQKELTR
jgi:hypothetical protein